MKMTWFPEDNQKTISYFGLVQPSNRIEDWQAKANGLLERKRQSQWQAQLCRFLESFDASAAARENCQLLASGQAVAVITGQQVGFAGGPLLTFYKTLTAVCLARQLRESLGVPVVPVLWAEGEDHDFREMAQFAEFGINRLSLIEAEEPPVDLLRPVGPRQLPESLLETFRLWWNRLLNTHPPDAALNQWAVQWLQPGRTFYEAFVSFYLKTFAEEGLVVFPASLSSAKKAALPLYRWAFEERRQIESEMVRRSEELEERGLPTQVHIHAGSPLFFVLENGRRYRLFGTDSGGFSIGKNGRPIHHDELSTILAEPDRLSTSALLRPAVQDFLLPTLAYVGGPSEVSYWRQATVIHKLRDLPIPIVVERAHFVLVEPAAARFLQKQGLDIKQLAQSAEELHRLLRTGDQDHQRLFEQAEERTRKIYTELGSWLETEEKTLLGSVQSSMNKSLSALENLQKKYQKSLRRKDAEWLDALHKWQSYLWPGDQPQERTCPAVYFLGRFGGDMLIDRLSGQVFPLDGKPRVIHLAKAGDRFED